MLARAFLRLCALEALRPSALLADNGPWPTLAGRYVSDSRIDPIDDVEADERRPILAVFTEGGSLSKIAQHGPQYYSNEVDLVFELSVVGKFVGDGGDLIVDYADTDAALEAQLDVIEDQVFHALHFGPTGHLFRQMCKLPFLEWKSEPHRSGEEAIRLAKRTVRAGIKVKESCYVALPHAVATGLDRLPPALTAIAEQLGGSTYLADLALALAHAAPQMPVATPLQSVAPVIHTTPAGAPVNADYSNLQGES